MAFPCRRIRRFFAIFAATNNNGMRFALQLLPLPLVFSLSAMGQTTATVIDMETHVPMRGVEVVVNGSYDGKVATNYTGAFAVDGKVNDITLIKRVSGETASGVRIPLFPQKISDLRRIMTYKCTSHNE